MDENRAFALATHLGAAHFHECHRLGQAGVSNSLNTRDRQSLAGIVWHGVCQTQDAMSDFQTLDWKDHAVIAGVCICCVVESGQSTAPSTFDKQLKESSEAVKTAETKADGAQKTAYRANVKADAATVSSKTLESCIRQNAFNKLENAVQQLQKKVKELEAKLAKET